MFFAADFAVGIAACVGVMVATIIGVVVATFNSQDTHVPNSKPAQIFTFGVYMVPFVVWWLPYGLMQGGSAWGASRTTAVMPRL